MRRQIKLASGQARRFGDVKLLADLGGKTVLWRTLLCVRDDPLLFVRTASIFPDIRKESERCGVAAVTPSGPALSDTIRAGLEGAEDMGWKGCLFLPGDQPLVRQKTIEDMVRVFLADPSMPVRLSFGGVPASPVIFPASMFEALRSLEGERGGSSLLKEEGSAVLVPAKEECELWDIDTVADLEKIRAHLKD